MWRTNDLLHAEHLPITITDVNPDGSAFELVCCCGNIWVAHAAFDELVRRRPHRRFRMNDVARIIRESWKE